MNHFLNNVRILFGFISSSFRSRPELFIVVLVAMTTILPHPPNVSPIGALGLFVGTYLRQHIYLLMPIGAAFIADLATTGLYTFIVLLFVYLGHFSTGFIGRYTLRGRKLTVYLPLGILVASISFFLLSNFGNWLAFYPTSLQGLMDCYVNGIPYFFNTLAGNALYSCLFFGCYEGFRYMFSFSEDRTYKA